MSRNSIIAIIIIAVLGVCCLCVAAVVGFFAWSTYRVANATEFAPFITEVFTPPTDTPVPVIVLTPPPTPVPGSSDTLQTLEDELIPTNDLRELAMRLQGIPDIPVTVGDTDNDWPIGKELEFFASNTDTNANFKVTAELLYKTENVYFFAEKGVAVDKGEVKKLIDTFQDKIYPTDREFFGSEPNPGVDGDPHLYILFARGLGFSVAGYQSSADGFSRLAHENSNEKEMFYINADATGPGDPSLRYTLAHEFQHMIHGYHDVNEETWMNEGSSVLASFLNGDRNIGFDYSFVIDPDLQLNTWSEGGVTDDPGPHYGAGFLFMAYFLDRFGNEATQALVADEANGLRAVDDVLTEQSITDNGQQVTAADVFADWVIANYLGDTSIGDGRYGYNNYPDAPKIEFPTETFNECPINQSATVHQFAADYYEIRCSGQVTINFVGSQQIRVIPTDPHSGRYTFWSHRNDKSDTTLTREFDLSGVSSATLNYWAWWALEVDYDYAYVEVSTDGGQTFTILDTPSCTTEDPSGNSFGCGYNGNSGGGEESQWVEESVDLTPYAGQKILVRFEYITDDAVNRAGLMVDDISVPELTYTEDFESGDGEWDGQGFVRIDNILPQSFVVQVIQGQGSGATVERLELDAADTGSVTLDIPGGEAVTLVISGVTAFTTEVASYQFEVK